MRHVTASVLSIILTIFAVTIMSYVSMATPIGPWIAPTLALCAIGMVRGMSGYSRETLLVHALSAGSIGGIAATGVAFSFPALHFLMPEMFAQWVAQPVLLEAQGFFLTTEACDEFSVPSSAGYGRAFPVS